MIQTINVYYGGNYEEHWTPEQRLFISYSSRETFTAEKSEGRWVCTTHLPSYPLSETYFQAVCEIQEAMQTCSQLGLDARRLTDLLQTDNVVAPFELLRALLDDWGYQFYDALTTVVRCCRNIDIGIRFEDLVRLQPRTAFLTDVLYQGLRDFTLAYHDRKDPMYRNPVSAVREGSLLHLGFRDCGRRIPSASCIIFGDFGERIFPMRRTKKGFQADIAMHFEPQPLWYVFRLETDNGYQYLNSDSTGFGSVVSPQRGLGFRLTVFKKDFETPEWFRHCIMYQIFPDRFATSDDNTARKGLEYHRSLGQSPDFHESTDEPVKWQARPGEDFYSPDDFYGGTLKGIISKLDYLHDLGSWRQNPTTVTTLPITWPWIRSWGLWRIMRSSAARRRNWGSASSMTAFSPTPVPTACTSTAIATIRRWVPVRDPSPLISPGIRSIISMTATNAGGTSGIFRKWMRKIPYGRISSLPARTAW